MIEFLKEQALAIATVIGALITTIGTIIAAKIKTKKNQHVDSTERIIIPHKDGTKKDDPFLNLKSDFCNIKDIENMVPLSDEYYKAFLIRVSMMKNPNTEIKVKLGDNDGKKHNFK